MSFSLLEGANTTDVYNDWITLVLKSNENLEKTVFLISKYFKVKGYENLHQAKEEENAARQGKSIAKECVIYYLYQHPKIKEPKYCFWFHGKLGSMLITKLKEKDISFSELGVNISRIDIKKKVSIPMNRDAMKREIQLIARKQKKIEKDQSLKRDIIVGGKDDLKVSMGNRKNQIFSRVYAEDGGEFSFEIELKGKATRSMTNAIQNDDWNKFKQQEIKIYEKHAKKLATTDVTCFFKNHSQQVKSQPLSKDEKQKKKLENEKRNQKITKSYKMEIPHFTPFRINNNVFFNPALLEVFIQTFDSNAVFLAWILNDALFCKELPEKNKTILNLLQRYPFRIWETEVQREKVNSIMTLEISRKEICDKLIIPHRSESYILIQNLLYKLLDIRYQRDIELVGQDKKIPKNGYIIENIEGLLNKGKNPIYKIRFGPMMFSYANESSLSYEKFIISKILRFFKTFCFKGKQSDFLVTLLLYIFYVNPSFDKEKLFKIHDFFPPVKRDQRVYQLISSYLTRFLSKGNERQLIFKELSSEERDELIAYTDSRKKYAKIKNAPLVSDHLFIFKSYEKMKEYKIRHGFVDTWPTF